jgi:serine protease Do
LKFRREVEIVMPDHVLGRADEIAPGAPLGVVGYPFGFYHVYSQCIIGASLSNKMLSRRGNNLLLFDAAINDGMRGAPLISVDDGRVVGVVNGRFNPAEAMSAPPEVTPPVNHFSYAVSIEYAAPLIEAEGLEVI